MTEIIRSETLDDNLQITKVNDHALNQPNVTLFAVLENCATVFCGYVTQDSSPVKSFLKSIKQKSVN